jgi:hypothetical protein
MESRPCWSQISSWRSNANSSMRVDVAALGSSLETSLQGGMLYKHGRDPEKGAQMKRRRRTLIRVIRTL